MVLMEHHRTTNNHPIKIYLISNGTWTDRLHCAYFQAFTDSLSARLLMKSWWNLPQEKLRKKTLQICIDETARELQIRLGSKDEKVCNVNVFTLAVRIGKENGRELDSAANDAIKSTLIRFLLFSTTWNNNNNSFLSNYFRLNENPVSWDGKTFSSPCREY